MLLPLHCRCCKQLIPVDPAKFYSVPWLSFSKAAPLDFQSQSRPVVGRREALMTCSPYGICGKVERDPFEDGVHKPEGKQPFGRVQINLDLPNRIIA